MKIDDPKTPYHDDSDEEMTEPVQATPDDPVVMERLKLAKDNRDKNAAMSSNYQAPKAVDMGDLAAKLQGVQDQAQSEAESKLQGL